MIPIVVVENVKRFPFHLEGVEVVSAKSYLVDPRFSDLRRAAVFNLCRSYGYQTVGYYVSLLAAARGHRPLPSVGTLQSLGENVLVKIVSDDLEELIEKSLVRHEGHEFRLSIYFGRNADEKYDRLSRALFNEFPAPFLSARFAKVKNGDPEGHWRLVSVRPLGTSEIPDDHRDFVLEQARGYFERPSRTRGPRSYRYELAILWRDDDDNAPSDDRAIKRFARAFQAVGIDAEVVGPDDYARIAEFDALFIRETTWVEHHTYRFARRALREGLVVIDHPEAIIRCSNKVYQAELFERHEIPCPKTLVLHEGNIDDVAATVGFPCVLKRPDGAFSQGVVKIENVEELKAQLPVLLKESELVVAQEWMPSSFDWRVGVLDKKPLWVCKYHMSPGHWQIVRKVGPRTRYGRVEPIAMEDAPSAIVELAVRAASRFGGGLFGVDIKEVGKRAFVMEVNDNPNVDAGLEDAIVKDALYDAVARWFRERLDARGANGTG
jgi:glutathione synthase/RimK-type ligase-like ATP-grasp enzyme